EGNQERKHRHLHRTRGSAPALGIRATVPDSVVRASREMFFSRRRARRDSRAEMQPIMERLVDSLKGSQPTVAIVGLGYVGLPRAPAVGGAGRARSRVCLRR